MKLSRFSLLGLGLSLLPYNTVAGDEGDLVLEVVARTLDPSQLDWADIPLTFPGGFYPVGMHRDGGVSFVARRTVNNETITGRYRITLSGGMETVAESGRVLNGVSYETRENLSSLVPWNATATSPSGRFDAIAMKAEEQNQGYLYLLENGSSAGAPIFWTTNLSLPGEGNYLDPLSIQDGRGEERSDYFGRGVPTMLVTDQGTVIWENTGGLFTPIFRAGSATGVKAVVYDNTAAPGIHSDSNATFTARNKLIGVDDSDNAFFFAEVQTASGRVPVVYRQNATGNHLTPVFVSNQTPLPSPDGGTPVKATVALDDCAVTGDGTVYLRVPLGSISTGFWKIDPTGQATPLGVFSEFTEINTNEGAIRFRNIDDADWAILNDGQIAFSSDIRSGASGTNEEGVWVLDPETEVVLTLVRAPLGGDYGSLPDTTPTFFKARNLAGNGEGYLAFLADLSDGTTGLYATDPSGGLVKIAREGDPLDGSTITEIHFTPDAVGERFDRNATTPGLRGNCGTPGLNHFGEIAFAADLANGKRVIVRTSFEGNRPPGAIFVWDGGAGDNNWHSIRGGRSNWTDENGQGRDAFPPMDGTAEVRINSDFLVEVMQSGIHVKSLDVANGSVDLGVDCQAETITVGRDASMVLGESAVRTNEFEINGLLSKEGESEASIEALRFHADNVPFTVEGGELKLQLTEGTFTDTPLIVEDGNLVLSGKFILDGEEAGITVKTFTGGVTWDSGTIRLLGDATFDAVSPASLIRWGGDSPDPILFEVTDEVTLTVKGAGRQELGKSLLIPEDMTVKVMTSPTPSGEGFVLDLEENETLEVAWRLENEGIMTMYGGSLRSKDFGFVTIGGEFVVEEAVTWLDANFSGTLIQLADVNYGVIRFGRNSKHRIRESTFAPDPNGSSALYYNNGSSVETIGEGDSTIVFDREEPGSFDAAVTVGGGQLEMRGATVDPQNLELRTYTVQLGAELTLKDFSPGLCRTAGGGLTRITGEITSGLISLLSVQTELFEIVDAHFLKWEGNGVRPAYLFEGGIQEGTMRDSIFGKDINFKMGEKSVVSVDGPLVLASQITILGIMELKADLQDSPLADGGGIALVSGKKNQGLVIPPNLPRPITIEVPLTFGIGSEQVFVGANSTLILPPRALGEVIVEGILEKGTWEMATGSRCQLTTSAGNDQVLGLGEKATLKLGTTTPDGKIFGDLPNFAHPFSVGGTLELDGTIFNMGGGTLYHRNKILMKNGAKVIGDVESIRDDVQGIVPLAGNFVIEGNLTSSGVISLGASPGAGLVTGNVTLLPGSEMIVEFAGDTPGSDFDFLEVGGELTLDGRVTLKLLDEYLPAPDQIFRFIASDGVVGDFTEIDQSEMGRQRRFSIASDEGGVTATADIISISSFEQWRSRFFSPADAANELVSGPDADPDNDGQNNLMEYATNGLPLKPGSGPLVFGLDGLDLRWANGVEDFTWELSTSIAMQNWQVIPDSPSVLSNRSDETVFRLEVAPSISRAPERYYRIALVPTGN